MKSVSAADAALSRAVGRSSASSRRSHSAAGSVLNTLPEPLVTAGTPAVRKASETRCAWTLVRTSTAKSPGPTFCADPSDWRTSAPESRSVTTSAARSRSTNVRVGIEQGIALRGQPDVVAVDDPDAQRRAWCTDQTGLCVRRGRDDLAVADPGMAELGAREQRVIGVDESLVAAPVGPQCGLCRRFVRGAEVGEDVGPPEGVDGLFRITDEHQGRAVGSEGPVHDVPLHQVRVLELVDQGDIEARAEPPRNGRTPLAVRARDRAA